MHDGGKTASPAQQFQEHHAGRPDVALEAVGVSSQPLGRHISKGAMVFADSSSSVRALLMPKSDNPRFAPTRQ